MTEEEIRVNKCFLLLRGAIPFLFQSYSHRIYFRTFFLVQDPSLNFCMKSRFFVGRTSKITLSSPSSNVGRTFEWGFGTTSSSRCRRCPRKKSPGANSARKRTDSACIFYSDFPRLSPVLSWPLDLSGAMGPGSALGFRSGRRIVVVKGLYFPTLLPPDAAERQAPRMRAAPFFLFSPLLHNMWIFADLFEFPCKSQFLYLRLLLFFGPFFSFFFSSHVALCAVLSNFFEQVDPSLPSRAARFV